MSGANVLDFVNAEMDIQLDRRRKRVRIVLTCDNLEQAELIFDDATRMARKGKLILRFKVGPKTS